MITIEQRGKNLIKCAKSQVTGYKLTNTNGYILMPNADGFNAVTGKNDRYGILLKPNTTYTLSAKNDDHNGYFYIEVRNGDSNTVRQIANQNHPPYTPYTFTTTDYLYPYFDLLVYLRDSSLPAVIEYIQLEEGSVATPYEDPWVNTLNFDANLHAGEFLQKSSGNIFYIHKNWYRDANNNAYEKLTFNAGVATPSALTSEPVIVQDISTGEIKNAMVSGSAVNVYLNQYDSWTTTNATTTSFTLTKVSLNDTYPVAINGTVTTSGFTQTTTQITFDTAVASGSTVSCVYPYLDTGYSSDAQVFYQVTPEDVAIIPNEQQQFVVLAQDDNQFSTTSTTLTTLKSVRIDTSNTNISFIQPIISLWNATSGAITTAGINVDGGTNYTTTSSSTTEQVITLSPIKISQGFHTINVVVSTNNASYSAYTQFLTIYGK